MSQKSIVGSLLIKYLTHHLMKGEVYLRTQKRETDNISERHMEVVCTEWHPINYSSHMASSVQQLLSSSLPLDSYRDFPHAQTQDVTLSAATCRTNKLSVCRQGSVAHMASTNSLLGF